MHLLPVLQGSLDRDAAAIDLAQTPADIVVLSFSDGDLSALASAVASAGLTSPSLRLAGLAQLKHPFSVDLYVEKVAARARFVLVRLLGGLDYWRYGVEELSAAARRHGFDLAAVPGCEQLDPRLDALSTLPVDDLRRLWRYLPRGRPGEPHPGVPLHGGQDRSRRGLGRAEGLAGRGGPCRLLAGLRRAPDLAVPDVPHALVTFYRSALLAGDIAPVDALADALQARGARVTAVSVTSLKDEAAATVLARIIAADPPDVILNTTAFSAQRTGGGTVLDGPTRPCCRSFSRAVRATPGPGARGVSARPTSP